MRIRLKIVGLSVGLSKDTNGIEQTDQERKQRLKLGLQDMWTWGGNNNCQMYMAGNMDRFANETDGKGQCGIEEKGSHQQVMSIYQNGCRGGKLGNLMLRDQG